MAGLKDFKHEYLKDFLDQQMYDHELPDHSAMVYSLTALEGILDSAGWELCEHDYQGSIDDATSCSRALSAEFTSLLNDYCDLVVSILGSECVEEYSRYRTLRLLSAVGD